MSNQVELLLKLALAAKTAADASGVPATPAPAPLGKPIELTNPNLPGSKPADLTPMSVDEADKIQNPPGMIQQGLNKATELGGQAVGAVQNMQTPAWLQGSMDWVKQHPAFSAGAGGLGVGALLAYTMLRRKNRKHAAALIRPHFDPKSISTKIDIQGPRSLGSMIRPDLAAGGPKATAMAIREAAGRPAGVGPKPAGSAQPAPAVPAAPAAQEAGMTSAKPGLGVGGAAAVSAGAAAAGAVGQRVVDQQSMHATNPTGNTPPTTGTGNALAGIGDGAQKYLEGFAQNPTKWDGSHIAGGVGAGALLAYLISRGGDD